MIILLFVLSPVGEKCSWHCPTTAHSAAMIPACACVTNWYIRGCGEGLGQLSKNHTNMYKVSVIYNTLASAQSVTVLWIVTKIVKNLKLHLFFSSWLPPPSLPLPQLTAPQPMAPLPPTIPPLHTNLLLTRRRSSPLSHLPMNME